MKQFYLLLLVLNISCALAYSNVKSQYVMPQCDPDKVQWYTITVYNKSVNILKYFSFVCLGFLIPIVAQCIFSVFMVNMFYQITFEVHFY